MSETAIFIEDSFDSAHWLPNVPEGHKCHRMHGHTYRIRLEVFGPVDPQSGWVVDYAELKADWEIIKRDLDHKTLNDILPNPTCELIAAYIGEWLPTVSQITLRETGGWGMMGGILVGTLIGLLALPVMSLAIFGWGATARIIRAGWEDLDRWRARTEWREKRPKG